MDIPSSISSHPQQPLNPGTDGRQPSSILHSRPSTRQYRLSTRQYRLSARQSLRRPLNHAASIQTELEYRQQPNSTLDFLVALPFSQTARVSRQPSQPTPRSRWSTGAFCSATRQSGFAIPDRGKGLFSWYYRHLHRRRLNISPGRSAHRSARPAKTLKIANPFRILLPILSPGRTIRQGNQPPCHVICRQRQASESD